MICKRINIATGTPWEPVVGYSRAVKVGAMIFVSGTTATDAEGNIVGKGDVRAQTIQAIENISTVLRRLGADLKDVVRTRLFVTNIKQWKQIGKAHSEFFKDIRPACTMVEVRRLASPKMLIEIEAAVAPK